MIVTVFRSRARPSLSPETTAHLGSIGARMDELARQQPGFISYKDFESPDGETVTVVEFDTIEHVVAWREHPEHKAAQALGRAEVFSEYTIHVCEVLRTSRFP